MTDFSPILKWYSGKALTTIKDYVLPTLAIAEELGYWPKGTSRKVKAALNKQTIAIKYARAHPIGYGAEGYHVNHAMQFGLFERAPKYAGSYEWAIDFAPVAELTKLLDSRRPKPTYLFATLSPTVVANVGKALGVKLSTIASPPVEWNLVKRTLPNGTVVEVWEGKILWPEGTKHNQSKFAWGSRTGNDQCHACGHAIKNGHNWVPLVATGETTPISLWVGKDCASKLFGCKVDGEGTYPERV